jgi:hypothetical protein
MNYPKEQDKKLREKKLIEDFVGLCSDFSGWKFDAFSENPDVIMRKEEYLLGFESVIISDDQASVQCVYRPELCALSLPANLPHDQRLNEIEVFFSNKLYDHLRKYSMPTVLVFSLVDTQSTSFEDIVEIAKKFILPTLKDFNIEAYYICNENSYVRIASAKE